MSLKLYAVKPQNVWIEFTLLEKIQKYTTRR